MFKGLSPVQGVSSDKSMLPACKRYALGLPKICFWVAKAMLLAP